ncbi:MAG: hypothetical protein HXX09_17225 [Bacteroidetes bacterium]|nr:hypothetical protein [Bacteroidota bacterium]
MKKLKVLFDFLRLSVPNLIEFSRNVVAKITGNASFTTPDIPVAQITTATNNVETAYNAAKNGGKQQTANLHAAVAILIDLLRRQALYVDRIAFGSETIILSSGYTTTHQPLPKIAPEFDAKIGKSSGKILLSHKAVKNAGAFMWEYSTDGSLTDQTNWTLLKVTTQSKVEISELESGSKLWFRSAVVTPTGQGAWSNPIMKVVP